MEKHALGAGELSACLYGTRVACDEGGYATCLAVLVSGPKLDINAVRRAVNRGSSIIEFIVSALMDVRSLVVYRERSSVVGRWSGICSESLWHDVSWILIFDSLTLVRSDCPSRAYALKGVRAGGCSAVGGASALIVRCRWYGGVGLSRRAGSSLAR